MVDPLGYPFTAMDYLRVFDSYLGGLGAFDYVDESRDCVSNLQDKLDVLNHTFMAWDFRDEVFGREMNVTNYTYSIYSEDFNDTIYNATEVISQDIAPIYLYCAQSAYIGYDMFYTKQL